MGTEHKEINTAGQTKQQSDLQPSDRGPFPELFFKDKMKKKSRLQIG